MRKLLTSVFAALLAGSLFAGGVVTNTNQSASWVRLPSRNASTEVDAAYFNPAGMMSLENGFHFSVSNQSIFQTKTVENLYKGPGGVYGLNESVYKGDIVAPLFPSIYAVYKTDRLAFSFGFNPVGGGGGATYNAGLPSFEMTPSDLVPALAASQGATAYRLDAFLEGTSVFFGFQGNVAMKINDWLSIAAGLRYVMAKNTYMGHLTDIEVQLPSGWTRADDIMNGISALAGTSGDNLQAAITAGFVGAGDPVGPAVAAGLTQLGINPTGFNNGMAVYAFGQAEAKYAGTAILLGDQEVDAVQKGSGISPIVSVNITPSENLNIAIKYEARTNMMLENETAKDFMVGFDPAGVPVTMFKDGDLTPSDMPSMLSLGVNYKLSDNLRLSVGGNYFFDKSANYGRKVDLDHNSSTASTFISNEEIIDNNGYSLQGGLEYHITDKILISGGYIFANQGVNEKYQSDMTYFLGTHTFGAGGAYRVTDNILINLGASFTSYINDDKLVEHIFSANNSMYFVPESYDKQTFMVGIGVDFHF